MVPIHLDVKEPFGRLCVLVWDVFLASDAWKFHLVIIADVPPLIVLRSLWHIPSTPNLIIPTLRSNIPSGDLVFWIKTSFLGLDSFNIHLGPI